MKIEQNKVNENVMLILKKIIKFYKYKTFLDFYDFDKSIIAKLLDEVSSNNGIAYINDNCFLDIQKDNKMHSVINFKQNINDFKYYLDLKRINIDFIHLCSLDVESNFDEYYFRLSTDGIMIITGLDNIKKKDLLKKIKNSEKGIILYYDKENIIIKKSFVDKIGLKINEGMSKRLTSICNDYKNKIKIEKPIVYVGILTYNHNKYIEECLNSVFKQKGNFKLKIIIIDDFSNDNNVDIIEKTLKKYPKNVDIEYKFIKNKKNIGIVNNMKKLCDIFKDGDFYTFCEGDDFWLSEERIQKFVNYMNSDVSVTVAFNKMYLYNQKTNSISKNKDHEVLINNHYTTENLINFQNFIGNWSCCFYRCVDLKYLEEKYFDITMYDFFFNIVLSQYGFIGVLNEYLSVYRYHDTSAWSSCSSSFKSKKLYEFIFHYNIMTDYIYNDAFIEFQNGILKSNTKKIFSYQKILIDNFINITSYKEFKNKIDTYFEKFDDKSFQIIVDLPLDKTLIYNWIKKYMIENNFKKNIVMFSELLFEYTNCKKYLFQDEELLKNNKIKIDKYKKAKIELI